jgi:type IV secretion system protein VirD4
VSPATHPPPVLMPALAGRHAPNALAPVLGGPPPRALELLAAIALLAAATVLLAWRTRRRGHPRAARFATRGELAQLHIPRPTPGRVTLGVHRGSLIAAEPRASVLVVGPSQAGKTTGLVVPALLEWQGPVLATSVKSDVVHDTHAARAARGEVRVFDPTSSSSLPHAPWSPIRAATTWEGARRTAARLLGVGEHGHTSSADEAFWRPAGARFLAPLLLAAAHGDLTMREVLSWVANTNEDEPTALLEHNPTAGAEPALEALRSVWDADPRFRSSLLQTIATALDPWQEPQVAAATIGDTQITPSWLLDSPNTLYLISPAHDQRRLRGLFAALVADITAGAFERSTQTGKPIDPPLLLALDEAANVAPLPNLDEIASTGPGQGVQLLTVLQNLSQAQDRWGKDRAETIIANHRARLFTSGIGDRATLEHLTHTLGEEEITRTATHRRGLLQPGSHTHSTDFRALAPPNRVRQQQPDTALLAYGRLPPAWVHLRPWFKDPQLRATAAGNPTPGTPRRRAPRPSRAALTRLTHPAPHCRARRRPASNPPPQGEPT